MCVLEDDLSLRPLSLRWGSSKTGSSIRKRLLGEAQAWPLGEPLLGQCSLICHTKPAVEDKEQGCPDLLGELPLSNA